MRSNTVDGKTRQGRQSKTYALGEDLFAAAWSDLGLPRLGDWLAAVALGCEGTAFLCTGGDVECAAAVGAGRSLANELLS